MQLISNSVRYQNLSTFKYDKQASCTVLYIFFNVTSSKSMFKYLYGLINVKKTTTILEKYPIEKNPTRNLTRYYFYMYWVCNSNIELNTIKFSVNILFMLQQHRTQL